MTPIALRGQRVSLRPFRNDELERVLEVHRASSAEDYDHREGPDREQVRERIEASGSWTDGPAGLILAIESGGRLVGEMQARGGRAQLLPPGVYELGIELYDQTDRGKGLGSAAITEMIRYLFEEEMAHRVQISTDVDNGAMRGAAERGGLRFEGVLRGLFASTSLGLRDYALFGMTRDDYEDVKTRWTSTS
jgi:RimJ/RimL family protein N-acetyltransferase